MAQIKVTDITLAYENLIVTKDLSFKVEAGDYLCIVGENGSGKSTLVKAMLGLKQPRNGKIEFGDGLRQTEIGYLPQQTVMRRDFPATVREVVMSGLVREGKLFYSIKDKSKAYDILSLLGIEDLKNRSFCDLSGGQKQRTLLARALCKTEKLILLDEPTAALDSIAAGEFYAVIEKINKQHNITVIMVSHDMRCINYATHVLHIGGNNVFESKEEYLKRGVQGA